MSLLVDGFKEAIELLISGNDSVYSAIIVTITVSSWSILISLILGLPLGFLLGYYQFKGKTDEQGGISKRKAGCGWS